MDSGQISTILLAVGGFVLWLTSQLQQRARESREELKKLRKENGLLWRRNYNLATALDRRGIKRPAHDPDWIAYFQEEDEAKASIEGKNRSND